MRESLYDKYVDEHGCVDFGRSGGMSQQKEAKRFLSALNKQSELQQKDCFSISVSLLASLLYQLIYDQCSLSRSQINKILYFRKYTVWQIGFA